MSMREAINGHIAEGKLDNALAELKSGVRAKPAEADLRVILFELLCVKGDWHRALTQLNVAADLEASTLLMVQTYREVLQCEQFREAVFAGERTPLMFGEPPEWLATLLQALPLAMTGRVAEAKAIAEAAFDLADVHSGHWRGQAFDWLADADMRLGPVLEAIIDGRYYWVPVSSVVRIELSRPEDLRDLVWLPATFEWVNGGKVQGFMPSRYPVTTGEQESTELLARSTSWDDLGDGYYIGRGQRMLATNAEEFALLEGGEIVFGDGEKDHG